MDADERLGARRDFEVVQEDERLDQLAEIGGADEAGDGAVPVASGAVRDSASAGGHGSDHGSGCVHCHLQRGIDGDRMGVAPIN